MKWFSWSWDNLVLPLFRQLTPRQLLIVGAMVLVSCMGGFLGGIASYWFSGQQKLIERQAEFQGRQNEILQLQEEQLKKWLAALSASPTPQSQEELNRERARMNQLNRAYEAERERKKYDAAPDPRLPTPAKP